MKSCSHAAPRRYPSTLLHWIVPCNVKRHNGLSCMRCLTLHRPLTRPSHSHYLCTLYLYPVLCSHFLDSCFVLVSLHTIFSLLFALDPVFDSCVPFHTRETFIEPYTPTLYRRAVWWDAPIGRWVRPPAKEGSLPPSRRDQRPADPILYFRPVPAMVAGPGSGCGLPGAMWRGDGGDGETWRLLLPWKAWVA